LTPYTIHAEAEEELRAALASYEEERAGLGGEFRQEFEAALERVRQNPLMYAAEDASGARLCPFHRFAYNLVYLDLGDHIWIAAVAHQHRRPRYWARRRPG
jgi:plasmid stabilization system protein ParE